MDELEEFLKRAAEKRQARKGAPPRVPQAQRPQKLKPPPPRSVAPPPPRAKSRRPPPTPMEIAPEPVMEAEIIEDPTFAGSVQSHVARHLDNREFQQRSSRLGHSVDDTDAQLDAHLHQVFDHNVGRLSAAPSSSVHDDVQDAYEQKRPTPQEPAISMAQLLQNPLTLRNAFILSEVLRRPEF